MYRRVKSSIELKCKETISRNMLYALFVILRTLLPLNVIHLMIANLLLKTARTHIKDKVKFLQAEYALNKKERSAVRFINYSIIFQEANVPKIKVRFARNTTCYFQF